jgi:hypothetical protein
VDAHAKFDALVCRHVRIALRHAALRIDGAADGIHRAGELDQNSVSRAFDNAASVSRDRWFQKFTAVGVGGEICRNALRRVAYCPWSEEMANEATRVRFAHLHADWQPVAVENRMNLAGVSER